MSANGFKWSTCIVAILMSAILSNGIVHAESLLGVWTDKKGKHTYCFLKNNEFMFLTEKRAFTKKEKDISSNVSEGITDDLLKIEGVWQSSPGMCWLGDKKQQTGNLMIYIDELQCCISAQFLSNKLVLTDVWKKGSDWNNICENRVLNKEKTVKKEKK